MMMDVVDVITSTAVAPKQLVPDWSIQPHAVEARENLDRMNLGGRPPLNVCSGSKSQPVIDSCFKAKAGHRSSAGLLRNAGHLRISSRRFSCLARPIVLQTIDSQQLATRIAPNSGPIASSV